MGEKRFRQNGQPLIMKGYVYIHIYIYTNTNIYIHIYKYKQLPEEQNPKCGIFSLT